MKNKYVFVFEDNDCPSNMNKCYVFDNLADADVFFRNKDFLLDTYSDNSRFTIASATVQPMGGYYRWHGDIFLGQYA